MGKRKRDVGIFDRDGVLYGRVKNDVGTWVKKTLNTSDAVVARVRFRDFERREADPSYKASNEASLGDAIEDFLVSRRVTNDCAEGTMHMYKIKCGHFGRLLGDDLPLSHLAPPGGAVKVDRFLATRLAEGASRNTIGKELTALRGLLKVAQRSGKFPWPLYGVMPNKWSNDYDPRRTALTPAQVTALVGALAAPRAWTDSLGKKYVREDFAAERMNKAARVAFMVATGARLAEANRATRGQIDMRRGIVYFEISKTKKKGKREKFVPITPLTRPLLEQVLAATVGRGSAVPMFDPWANMIRELDLTCEDLKIPRVTANDLRRTHSNWLIDAGVATNFVADVLGHVDARMVEKVYGKLRPEQLRDRVIAAVAAAGVH